MLRYGRPSGRLHVTPRYRAISSRPWRSCTEHEARAARPPQALPPQVSSVGPPCVLAAWVRVLPLRPPLSTALLFQRVGGARRGKPGACGLSTAGAAQRPSCTANGLDWGRGTQAAGGALGQITRGEEPPLAELALGVPLGRAFFFFLPSLSVLRPPACPSAVRGPSLSFCMRDILRVRARSLNLRRGRNMCGRARKIYGTIFGAVATRYFQNLVSDARNRKVSTRRRRRRRRAGALSHSSAHRHLHGMPCGTTGSSTSP